MKNKKNQSIHTDGSGGEKMSVKRSIETSVGNIENEDQKEPVFHELNRVEDTKVKDAERALFRRLGKDARCDAWVWSQYYKEMVGDPSG